MRNFIVVFLSTVVAACSGAVGESITVEFNEQGGAAAQEPVEGGAEAAPDEGEPQEIEEPEPAEEPAEEQPRSVCEDLPEAHDFAVSPRSACTPGTESAALCGSVFGHRACNADGSGRSEAVCPEGTRGFDSRADTVIVTRAGLAEHPDFGALTDMVDGSRAAVVTVEQLVAAFPAWTVQESVRAGLVHLYRQELPRLRSELFVGSVKWRGFGNVTMLDELGETDVPFFYLDMPEHTGDVEVEEERMFPSLLPYAYLAAPWPADFGGRFWRPDIFTGDVTAQYLDLEGLDACTAPGECQSDFAAQAEKVRLWQASRDDVATETKIDGARCVDGFGDWHIQDDDLAYDGVARETFVHDCADGEIIGDVGEAAQVDGSDFLYLPWHGNQHGTVMADGWFWLNDQSTTFSGVVYAHTCVTGAADLRPFSVGGALTASPFGPIVFAGYPRTLTTGHEDPLSRALVAGRYTAAALFDGFRYDMTRGLPYRAAVKDMAGLTVYGDPRAIVMTPPSKRVRTLASRKDDGRRANCVDVSGGEPGGSVTLLVGGDELRTVELDRRGRARVEVTLPEDPTADIIHGDYCNARVEGCQVAGFRPELLTTLTCGGLLGTATAPSVEIASTRRVTGELRLEAWVVTRECEEGPASDCFYNEFGRRGERALGVRSVDAIEASQVLALDNPWALEFGDAEYLRAIVVRAKSVPTGDVVGECFVPLDLTVAEKHGLL
jgi:hypothetical protein